MLLIPAIDLKDGQCVRLQQGEMDRVTVFSDAPEQMAAHWVAQGARRLHLVDLNGAFAGKPVNKAAIQAILDTVGDDVPVAAFVIWKRLNATSIWASATSSSARQR